MSKPQNKPKNIFKFYSGVDSEFDRSVSKEFSYHDAINSIMLYRVDMIKSKVHELYGEARPQDKKILPPIELEIVLEIGDIDTSFRSEIGIFEERPESFNFGVFIDQLNEKEITLNRGDYFTYFDGEIDRIYEITYVSNNKMKNSLMGDKPLFILVDATQVKEDVVLPN